MIAHCTQGRADGCSNVSTSIFCIVEDSPLVRNRVWRWRKPPSQTQSACIFCEKKLCTWCGGSGIDLYWKPPGNYIAYQVLLAGGARGYRDQTTKPIEPNDRGRGRPEHSDQVTKQVMRNLDHVTWVSLRELVEYDWSQTIEHEVSLWLRDADAIADPSSFALHRDDAYESWRHVHPRSSPDGGFGVSSVSSVLSMDQADRILDGAHPAITIPWQNLAPDSRDRVRAKWTETLFVACGNFREFFDQFIDEETREMLPVARDAREQGDIVRYGRMSSQLDDVRFVFGFL